MSDGQITAKIFILLEALKKKFPAGSAKPDAKPRPNAIPARAVLCPISIAASAPLIASPAPPRCTQGKLPTNPPTPDPVSAPCLITQLCCTRISLDP
jgi:hypothetical protein